MGLINKMVTFVESDFVNQFNEPDGERALKDAESFSTFAMLLQHVD